MKRFDSAQPVHPLYIPISAPWPHDGESVEWWFVHGNFSADESLSGHFMLCIFRHDIGGAHSFSMLFRLEDSFHESPYIVSRTDRRVKDFLAWYKKKFQQTNLDANLLKIYFEEVEKYGLPKSQSSVESAVWFGEEDFSIAWTDFSLTRHDGALIVEFRVPWADAKTRLVLRSRTPVVDLDKLVNPGIGKVAYLTYPLCDLSGFYIGKDISGSGWFDHQWGDVSSGVTPQDDPTGQKRLLGWDWFGINLNDGRAVVISIHRDMETKKILGSNFVLINTDGMTQIITEFYAEPLRFWYSPKTCISYPVEWEISIPSLDGKLIFAPQRDDQEIPFPGVTRAIWEGSGQISGTMNDKPVEGTARLELYGYGYIFHLSDVLENFSRRIFRHIQDFFPEAPDGQFFEKYTGFAPGQGNVEAVRDFLTRPMWDLLHRGGVAGH
ncbi:MAG: lipocalin family protein [Desulfobacula sp.]|jgi:hypothetical protein